MSLIVEPYSDKSFIVKGDSRAWQTLLEENHGSWNRTLKGYLFSNKWLPQVQQLVSQINSGTIPQTNTVPVYAQKVKPMTLPGAQSTVVPIVSKTKTFTYTVHVPTLGDIVIIKIDGGNLETKVSYIFPNSDKIQLSRTNDQSETETYEAGVYAGTWKIRGEMREHTMLF